MIEINLLVVNNWRLSGLRVYWSYSKSNTGLGRGWIIWKTGWVRLELISISISFKMRFLRRFLFKLQSNKAKVRILLDHFFLIFQNFELELSDGFNWPHTRQRKWEYFMIPLTPRVKTPNLQDIQESHFKQTCQYLNSLRVTLNNLLYIYISIRFNTKNKIIILKPWLF